MTRPGLWLALALFALTRVIVLVAAYTAPQDRTRPQAPQWWPEPPMIRWDAGHYLRIMEAGYPPQINDTTAFFPLYPLLARPLVCLFPPGVALVVLSHLAATGAMVLFYLWCRRAADEAVGFRAVLLLSTFPTAMFLSTGYSEGVFLLWVALALWFIQGRHWWPGALTSALATATRPTGLALAVVFCLSAWAADRGRPLLRRLIRLAALGVLSVSGLIVFRVYLWHHYGRIDAWEAAQVYWSRPAVQDPLRKLFLLNPIVKPALRPIRCVLRGEFPRLLDPWTWNMTMNVAVLAVAGIGLVRPGPFPRLTFLLPIFIFLMAYLPDPFLGTRLVGIARYQLAALPCFALLAAPGWLGRRRLALGALAPAGMLLQVQYMRQFCNWILVS